MQSFHLRGDLNDVADVVTEFLDGEGFTLTESEGSRDPSVRRIAFYAQDGWVGLAEERFSMTEWGPVLSAALSTEVVTLAGECDHAFYTHVFVHAEGEEKHAARVPADITLDDDGEHRLRASFLPKPVSVNELGGEENMQAIGELLGIPRPLFHLEDGPALTLSFTYTSDQPAKAPDFAKLFGAEFAGMSDEIQSALKGLKVELAPGMRAMMGVRAAKTDGPPRLVACQESNRHETFAGESGHVHGSFLLEDAESAKGMTVSLYGDGLALFDAARIRARVGEQEWTALPAIEDGLVTFSLPNVELTQPAARPDTSHLPFEERMRQGMKRIGNIGLGANHAEVTVWIEGRFLESGEGELAMSASLDGQNAATTEIALRVKPAVRRPQLPAGVSTPHPVYVENYEARNVAYGWVAFDAKWDDVKETVLAIAREAERVMREATGSTSIEGHAHLRSGKRLTLKKDVWTKADKALAEGANLSVYLDKSLMGAALEMVHQPDGPNLLPTLTWEDRRPPVVWIAWWCPRPESEVGIRALAKLGEFTLSLAAKEASNLGGVVSAQGEYSRGMFETAYDRLAGLNATNDARWLATHARAPGWRVLLPPGVDSPNGSERVLDSSAPDPFAYSPAQAEAMERLILPLLA